MRVLLIGLLTSLFVTSCGLPLPFIKDQIVKDGDETRQFDSTNPVFNSYIQTYEQNGQALTGDSSFKVKDVPINFGDTENVAFQGVCFEYPDGTKEIIIRESWWNAVDQKYRESLLFHELGHCHLHRNHLDDTVDSNNGTHKVSMMNSVVVNPREFQQYENQYLYELYTRDQGPLIQTFNQ